MIPSDELSSPPASAIRPGGGGAAGTAIQSTSPSISADAGPDPSSLLPDYPPPVAGATPQWLGVLLVLLVTTLAVLLASSPVQNSDLWMHLVNGRLLVHGDYSVVTDSQLSEPGQHAWLYDVVCYAFYSALGGLGLMLFKIALVVGLVVVLLRLSWTGQGWPIPAVCTALVLLVIGTRLLLQFQPATASYLLLALTLWFLREREGVPAARTFSLLFPWPLLVLFVVWVNTDVWFNLGREIVALVWVGQVLDAAFAGRATGGPRQGWFRLLLYRIVAYVTLSAVCLLNPLHVHALLASAEQSWLGQATLPFQWVASVDGRLAAAYFLLLGLGLVSFAVNAACFLLLRLGLVSFAVNLPRWHWQRFLPWFGLAVCSAFFVRTVPFFAVVAGPVLAWNVQEWFAYRLDAQRRQQTGWQFALGRALAVLLALALVLSAWPGWLQGPPYEPRRWAITTPPSLQEGAAETKRWLADGKLGPDPKGLHLSRESAYAFAWFCPEAKAVRDDSLASAIRKDPGAADVWGKQMRAAGVNHVIVYDPDRGKRFAILGGLVANPEEWPLLYVKGDLAVFGWRDPARVEARDLFRDTQMDFNRLAFRPAEDRKAPAQGPERDPEVPEWYDAVWKPTLPRTIDRDEATLYLFYAEAVRRSAPLRHFQAWECSQAAGLVSAAGGWSGSGSLLDAHLRLTLIQPAIRDDASDPGVGPSTLDLMTLGLRSRFTAQRDDTSPALLYLAIRAARRAVAANPEEAQSYLVLGESYVRLLHATRERAWAQGQPMLVELRHAQASAALNQAIKLKPDFAEAHLRLYELYQQMGYRDLQRQHLRTYIRLAVEAGPPEGVDAEDFRKDKERWQDNLSRLDDYVKEQDDAFEIEAVRANGVLDRAMMAYRRGLAGKARDMLLESNIAAFGDRGTKLELDLLLGTGRSKDVQDWASPEHKAALGASGYHWLRVRASAASGNYVQAEDACKQLARATFSAALQDEGPTATRQIMASIISQAVFSEQPAGGALPLLFWKAYAQASMQARVADLAKPLRRDADMTVLRAVLALEQGDVDEAEIAFRQALAYWKDEATAASGGGLDFNGRRLAQGYLEWLK